MGPKIPPLIAASTLVEDDSGSLAALFKQHKAGAKAAVAKPKQKSATGTSRNSVALSQLAKAFKGTSDTKSGKGAYPDKSKPKTDSGVAKAAAAVSKQGQADSGLARGKRGGGSSVGTGGRGAGLAPAQPGIKEPHMDVKHPPGKWAAFDAKIPSLKQRARPDMIPHDERREDFSDRYNARDAKLDKMAYLGASSSHVFRGKMDDGTRFIAKPHEHPWGHGRGSAQPEHWEKRHKAVARLLTHMGAGHMIAPATTANIHGPDAMPSDHPSIEQQGRRSALHHSGKKAFVTEFIPNTVNGYEASKIANKVDRDHRVMGMITHLLTSNSDGHRGNVLINRDTGNPTLIDHDLSMSLGVKRGEIRSQFLPGEAYDYQGKGGGPVGKKYPPRVKDTLKWLAGGGHYHKDGGLDLENDDKAALRRTAEMMLKHGLEGTIEQLKKRGVQFRG